MSTDSGGGSNTGNGGGTPPVAPSSSETAPADRGGNRGGRGRGRRGGRGYGRSSGNVTRFEGREPSLKGFIFDYNGQKNPGQWITTVQEIETFVGRTYKQYTREFVQAIKDLELRDPIMPVLQNPEDFQEKEMWKLEIKDHRHKTQEYQAFRASLYAVVFGQCTKTMEERIKSHNDYDALDQDGIELLKLIQTLLHTYEDKIKVDDALDSIKTKFYSMKQGPHMRLQEYHERFLAQVQVLKEVGVNVADETLARAVAQDAGRNDPLPADYETAQERAIAMRFVAGLHQSEYLTHLRHSYLDGHDIYPTTLHQAYNTVERRGGAPQGVPIVNDGVAFTTAASEESNRNPVAATDGRVLPNIKCYGCQRMGHYANQCPFQGQSGASFHTRSGQFNIPKTWILLDSQSTVDLFTNRDLLTNVRKSPTCINIHCNAGSRTTDLVGDLPGYGTVWYDPNAIANILSVHKVKNQFHVQYDNHANDQFVVTRESDGASAVFQEAPSGLYYLDACDKQQGIFGLTGETETDGEYLFVNTVEENKLNYTVADYSRALAARKLQIKIGRPNTRDYRKWIKTNVIPNCPVTIRDVDMAEDIFGPDVGSLKGKTVRSRPHRVSQEIIERVPVSVLRQYQDVTLCGDILQVNGMNMLLTVSRNIRFCTIEALANKNDTTLVKAIRRVQQIYQRGGFRVRTVLFDGAFDSLRDELAGIGIALNTTSRDEHVGEAERMIRTVKERMRSIYNTLPFKRVPARLVIEMAKASVFWLNAFPSKGGISETMSPRTIVVGQKVDYNKHCQYEFGEYVQTHEEHDNTMASRTIGALALRPTGNEQGGYYFFSLTTGRVINRYRATTLPMPNDVVEHVENIARRQKANPGLVFQNHDGTYHADEDDTMDTEDDETYVPQDHDNEDMSEDDDYTEVSADDDEYNIDEQEDEHDAGLVYEDAEEHEQDAGMMANDGDNETIANDGDDETIEMVFESDSEEEPNLFENHEDNNEVDEPEQADNADDIDEQPNNEEPNEQPNERQMEDDIENEMNERYGRRPDRYELRPRRERQYDHLFVQNETTEAQVHNNKTGVAVENTGVMKVHDKKTGVADENTGVTEGQHGSLATEQMSLKQGLRRFGNAGYDALRKEIVQLHERQVMKPCDWKSLSHEERKRALSYLIFLKRKRSGVVKARGCADGRPQRAWTNPEDARSPTVGNESVFLTAVMDAKEGREVAVVDVPGAFMQADMDELVHVRLEGPVVDMLLEIDRPFYSKYVGQERGRKVIYVELLKALYGTLRAARLFWEMLVAKLEEWGFTPNPYDQCVANKMVNGKQLTVAWHVDDLKVSHVEKEVVDDFIRQMRGTFAREGPLSESRGKTHDYLGMTLDFSTAGKLVVSMSEYVQGMINNAPQDMAGVAATPAGTNLFVKRSDAQREVLDGSRRDVFVHLTMQALYLSQRARPDIRTAVSFLSSRIQEPDEDDYGKLKRLIRYLRATVDMRLTLSAGDIGRISWWIDASYAVHDNMRGHTGATMSMGAGSVYSTSTKQKLVSRSSTESEVIGVYDVLPQVQWTFEFLRSQGVDVRYSTLYQDNKSAMLLERNGRMSSTKRTKHMNVRYFYIADLISNGTVVVEHCPTEDMLADYFTKPLQGKIFWKLRDLIMNFGPDCKYHSSHRSVLRNNEKRADESEKERTSTVRTYRDVLVSAGPVDG